MRLVDVLKIIKYIADAWVKFFLKIAVVSLVILAVYNMCLVDTTHLPLSFRAVFGLSLIISLLFAA